MDDAAHPDGKGFGPPELRQPFDHPNLDKLRQVFGVLATEAVLALRELDGQPPHRVKKTPPCLRIALDAGRDHALQVVRQLALEPVHAPPHRCHPYSNDARMTAPIDSERSSGRPGPTSAGGSRGRWRSILCSAGSLDQ